MTHMDRQRLNLEIAALARLAEQLEGTVTYDLNEGWAEISSLPLPNGWNRETTAVRIEFPEDYPFGLVPRVYVPDDLWYDGRRPHTMSPMGPPGWSLYDLRLLEFDPDYHTPLTVLRVLQMSLKDSRIQ